MLQIVHDVAPAASSASPRRSRASSASPTTSARSPTRTASARPTSSSTTSATSTSRSSPTASSATPSTTSPRRASTTSAPPATPVSSRPGTPRSSLIPAKKGLKGTNLDFDDVDPALYDGGLQDMNPGRRHRRRPGPQARRGRRLHRPPVGRPGRHRRRDATAPRSSAPPASSPTPNPSGATTSPRPPRRSASSVRVPHRRRSRPAPPTWSSRSTDPDGTNLGEVDTGASPEVLATTLKQAGTYTITVTGFDGDDRRLHGRRPPGPRPVEGHHGLQRCCSSTRTATSSASVADVNTLSGRPLRDRRTSTALAEIQLVISRAGTGPVGATQLRNVLFGDMYFTEYFDPLAPATFGHALAAGRDGGGGLRPVQVLPAGALHLAGW